MLILGIALVGGIACQAPAPEAPPPPPPAPDYAAALSPAVDTFIEVWNSTEYDRLDGVMAPDF